MCVCVCDPHLAFRLRLPFPSCAGFSAFLLSSVQITADERRRVSTSAGVRSLAEAEEPETTTTTQTRGEGLFPQYHLLLFHLCL